MFDKIEKIGKSLIQHGKSNDRIYLMKLDSSDTTDIINQIDKIAKQNDYSKIFAKIPEKFAEPFINTGYEIEAFVKDFYNARENGLFLARYMKDSRRSLSDEDRVEIAKILDISRSRAFQKSDYVLPDGYSMRKLEKDDSEVLSKLYKTVFATYPFPIHDSRFIRETMDANLEYFGVFNSDQELVAASSAEKYPEYSNVEMTDFATDPGFTGHGFATGLLRLMENGMKEQDMKNLYTIARAHSFGMNITFSKNGYKFGGTLMNNTNISGRIESMNVWYKNI